MLLSRIRHAASRSSFLRCVCVCLGLFPLDGCYAYSRVIAADFQRLLVRIVSLKREGAFSDTTQGYTSTGSPVLFTARRSVAVVPLVGVNNGQFDVAVQRVARLRSGMGTLVLIAGVVVAVVLLLVPRDATTVPGGPY